MAKYLQKNVTTGITEQKTPIVVSGGAGDASKIPQTDGSGRLDITVMPAGVGPAVFSGTAFEALSARDFVYVKPDGTIAKADGAAVSNAAMGYVIAAHIVGAPATVYYGDILNGFTGLNPGATYFLSQTVPGAIVLAGALVDAGGNVVQVLGRAKSATELVVNIEEDPVIL
jgi:hypothetical protein